MIKNKYIAWLLAFTVFLSVFSTNLSISYASEAVQADTEKPLIAVDGLQNNQVVSERDISFSVTVTDNVYKNITPQVTLRGAVIPAVNGEYKAALASGANLFTITAIDGAGNKAEEALLVTRQISATQLAKEQLESNLAYLVRTVTNPSFGTGGGEWTIISLARAGYLVPDGYYDLYYSNVTSKIPQLMNQYSGKLDRNKGTEHSRLILGLTSIGRDVTDVAGYDITAALADYQYVLRQGINGPIFALLALDSANYDMPHADGVAVEATRDSFIAYILDKEIKKGTEQAGGWALGGSTPDPDITAMAIQGLARYYNTDENVKAAIDRAFTWLSGTQNSTGGFTSWGSTSSESISQVIVALTAVGVDPHTDSRFVKNGYSLLDALLAFAVPEGGFKHILTGRVDGMATDQGTYALVAYDRFINGQNSLFDMREEPEKPEEPGNPENPENPGPPNDAVLPLPTGDAPVLTVPQDDKSYTIPVTAADSGKTIQINIPQDKSAKVALELPQNSSLPAITAAKGGVTAFIPQNTHVLSGDASALELLSSSILTSAELEDKLKQIIPQTRKLDAIVQVISMGGAARVEFSDYITLTFAGMSGKEAAYIQGGQPYAISKYASDAEGLSSGKAEYAYDSGNDLIVKTKHFTDYAAYTSTIVEAPGSGGGNGTVTQPKSYVTLSVDKQTIGKGNVISSTSVELQAGDTAWSVLKRVLDERQISYDYAWTEKYDSVYVQAIAGDGEFDHGSGSGWMYSVNGIFPEYGASKYILNDGDRLQWRYTTDLGADLGEDLSKWEGSAPSGSGGAGVKPDNGSAVEDTKEQEAGSVDLKKLYADASAISPWALEAISAATQNGFIQGSNGKFNPKSTVTRAEFTKMLVAVLGLDIQAGQASGFTDVSSKDWFYPYVNTASQAGLITGYNNEFNPNASITREQMAVLIVRALGLEAVKGSAAITDMDSVSAWAKAEVETALAVQLMLGDQNRFDPKAAVTREMAAVVAMRAYDYKLAHKAEESKDSDAKDAEVQKQILQTAAFLQKAVADPVIASVGGEWTVLALARSGVQVPDDYYDAYYANVEKTLKQKSGKLHSVKYTEYDRVILALTSIGKPVDNVGGYDLREPLADFDTLIKQGINGPIFALIALDSKSYEIPLVEGVKTQTTRELLIDFIMDREISGGGWALGQNAAEADPDITAMALQALTPYYKSNEAVKAAVDRGIEWLSAAQSADGGYASWDSVNSESAAQVIVALTGLGIDPHRDSRFIKNGFSPLDALLGFAAADGGFYHIKKGGKDNGGAAPGEVDLMATDQAMYALVAYDRFVNGQPRLYDMTDVQ